jgi:ankyrin repeat protein
MSGGNWKEMFNAACSGDLALVEYHVHAGTDIDYAHPEFLSTPLVACILAGQAQVALFLLERGANPQLCSEFDGLTPLQAARQAGLAEVERRLLALGAPALPPPRRAERWWSRVWRKAWA